MVNETPHETKAKWEDDGVGKIVRIKYGPDGHVALADAAYVNRLEEVNSDLLAGAAMAVHAFETWNNGSGHESACFTQSGEPAAECDCGADKLRAAIAAARGAS